VKRAFVAATLLVALPTVPTLAAPKPPPARVQIVAKEFSLALSRRTIVTGPAILELANFGEDPHDLKLKRQAAGAPTLTIPEVGPARQKQLRARLAPGRFVLWCSIADHRELGMEAHLTVRRTRS
jgi:hypothetical protein